MLDLRAGHRENGDLLVLLKETRDRLGGLTPDVVVRLAAHLGMPVGDLYGIVSFYSFLSCEPVGRHTIWLCQCVPCHLGGSDAAQAMLECALGVKPGQTTPDGRFTLRLTSCIGACGRGPAMLVDDRRFTSLTELSLEDILSEID